MNVNHWSGLVSLIILGLISFWILVPTIESPKCSESDFKGDINDASEITSYEKCRQTFNLETEKHFGLNVLVPVPLSLFNNGTSVYFIFAIRLHQGDYDTGFAVPPDNAGRIPHLTSWFYSVWKVSYCKDGLIHHAKCSPIRYSLQRIGEALVVKCSLKNPVNDFTRFTISSKISFEGEEIKINYPNLLSCSEPNQQSFDLAMCTLVGEKHVSRLPEFLVYHQIIGVKKTFLYFNMKPHDYLDVKKFISPFIGNGMVVTIPYYFPTRPKPMGIQHPSSSDCLLRNRGKITWTAIIDVDEFIHFPPSSPVNTLPGLLKYYTENIDKNAASLLFERLSYHPTNNRRIPACLCNISFIGEWLWRDIHQVRPGKTIYRSDRIIYVNAHKSIQQHLGIVGVVPDTLGICAHFRYPAKLNVTDDAVSYLVYDPSFKDAYGDIVEERVIRSGVQLGENCCTYKNFIPPVIPNTTVQVKHIDSLR